MIIQDKEFGEVLIRKNAFSSIVKFSIATSGRLQISAPTHLSNRHILRVLESSRSQIKTKLNPNNPQTQRARDAKKKLLLKQAKDFLPYRLDYFAKRFGYHYDNFRVSHASTRWGSCTHHLKTGKTTISLNIGLMQIPEALRDYVIIHELAHLNHPDHSRAFWAEVAKHDKNYRFHDRTLKKYNPGVGYSNQP